jgi:hypothetical protein
MAKHKLDDDRILKDSEEVHFTEEERFAHFSYLESMHIHNRTYPSIEEQLDMLYWDKVNGTEKWKEAIDKIKADAPKQNTSDMSKVKDEFGN